MKSPLFITAVTPSLGHGRYATKRVLGDSCNVEADILVDGHWLVRAVVRWLPPRLARTASHDPTDESWSEAPLAPLCPTDGKPDHVEDHWGGSFSAERIGRYRFSIEAWTDRYGSWLRDLGKKVRARKEVRPDREAGRVLVSAYAAHARGANQLDVATTLQRYAALLRVAPDDRAALQLASERALRSAMEVADPRLDVARSEPLVIDVDRERARFGSWYELFPRSQGDDGKHGTFATAQRRLPQLAKLGFDVIYLPPIHPVGRVNRKGKDNCLTAEPCDPGSPWAIGSSCGGHDAIEPALGTLRDFEDFVARTQELGMEVAIDFAVQCAPDHPWVVQHPEWFFHRPDGSIKHAENSPKAYEDVYPLDFRIDEVDALKQALLDVLLFWVEHGVRIFRVDNPHTKPVWLWEWLIAEVKGRDSTVLFLAEAFSRPKLMRTLALIGFTQSYTYFTWRNTKAELTTYLTEFSTPPVREYFRPNFFVNTSDILPETLQKELKPAFESTLVLAATLSPTYGIYSGYELCEGKARPHSEEYDRSEKYELKHRDFDAPWNINAWIERVNAARRDNPALQTLWPLTFLFIDNNQLLLFAKSSIDRSNVVIVAVNLDPENAHHARCHVPHDVIGVAPGERYDVVDALSDARYDWGEDNFVRLDPAVQCAHIFRVERRS